MLQTIASDTKLRLALRCVWVPSHTGANAPLTAVWIETAPSNEETADDLVLSLDGPKPWLYVA
jgi:hypothetical protein